MFNLGRLALLKEDKPTAVNWMKQSVEADPRYADPWVGLGILHAAEGEMTEMMDCFQKAIECKPEDPEIFFSFGSILLSHGHLDSAANVFEYALTFKPDSVAVLSNLGTTLFQLGRAAESMKTFDRLFAITPDFLDARLNYGNLLVSLGRVAEGLELHRGVIKEIDSAPANMLIDMCYVCEDPVELEQAHRGWPQHLRAPLPQPNSGHSNSPDRDRKLRIGFVSADFRTHSVAYFIESIFEYLDRSRFEIHAYSTGWTDDVTTQRLKGHATGWRRITGVPDRDACTLIREDGIDILIDLAGHTSGNRTNVLAHKPAPVQASYLGYPTLIGLPTLDYRLTDWEVDPKGTEEKGSERPVRLPHSYFCFRPAADSPDVGPLPMERNGYVTYGSFNNLAKMSPAVVGLWSKLLAEDPGARLLIKSKGLNDPDTQERLRAALCANGASPDRIDLMTWESSQASHLDVYNRVDVALDSFPYNGATTTCEALWMGVPVISLAGATHPSRMGRSILRAAGLTELLVDSTDAYLELARQLARDPSRLASLRATLRQRLRESPLLDGSGFARDFGLALRDMWVRWCATART
jgi:predicted O-linked N-acetylglucosamine transferase (SPINDLY family)